MKLSQKWWNFKFWQKMKKFQNLTKNDEISKFDQKWRNFKIWPKMMKFQKLTKNEEISKFDQIWRYFKIWLKWWNFKIEKKLCIYACKKLCKLQIKECALMSRFEVELCSVLFLPGVSLNNMCDSNRWHWQLHLFTIWNFTSVNVWWTMRIFRNTVEW